MFSASVYELSCVTGPRELGKTKPVPLKNIQSNRGDWHSHLEPQSIVGTDGMGERERRIKHTYQVVNLGRIPEF